jgi:hypothetical protein
MTVMALILAMYFGVGRWMGMSTSDVLAQGLGRSLLRLPTLLVWAAGLIMAIRHLKRSRLSATLTMIALAGMMTTEFSLELVQMALIHSINSGQISSETISWSFGWIGVLHSVINAGFWICILAAIFAQRAGDEKVVAAEAPERS